MIVPAATPSHGRVHAVGTPFPESHPAPRSRAVDTFVAV
jgi:hypothetical protein